MTDDEAIPGDEPSLALKAVYGVLSDLEPFWVEHFKMGAPEEFTEYVNEMMNTPEASGDVMARNLGRMVDASEEELAALLKEAWPHLALRDDKPLPPHLAKIRVIELAMLDVACLFVVQTVRAEVEGAPDTEQWELACEARRRLGMLQGYHLGTQYRTGIERSGISALAKLGADALHKENREMRQQAYDWLDLHANEYKSMEAAAEALREVVPVKHRTLVDYVKSHRKLKKNR